MQRRDFLKVTGTLGGSGLLPMSTLLAATQEAPQAGEGKPFDFAWLKGLARHLSQQSPRQHTVTLPEPIRDLGWDTYKAIQYRPARALWKDIAGADFRAQLFHLGLHYKTPVKIHEVIDGQAYELDYDPNRFDFGDSGIAGQQLPEDLGYAGFRLHHRDDWQRDIASFLGASYFRAVSDSMQYGLSARGLAIDTAMAGQEEEFPDFTQFWLERPSGEGEKSHVTVHALLESASVTGAYRFIIHEVEEGVVMDVDLALYPRRSIERLGVAPLTSMYMIGENDRDANWDWRPEIHDSDGLSIQAANGEWLWRPLVNPPQLRFNAFGDRAPQGFGLLQRDRDFDHYQDDGVYYDRRPSLWVEPKGDWGQGTVQLVELPTLDETFDNIVAFWNPQKPAEPGEELLFGYRLHWCNTVPTQPPLARCVATRTGLGGVVGQRRKYFSWRFVVDFAGGPLPLDEGVEVEPVIDASAGRVEIASARPLDAIEGYRARFDVVPPDEGTEPINLRLYLKRGDQPLTETWVYQWTPPPVEERKLRNPGHLE
ncbi:glucan biosynthesis protein [Halomonas halmophila]|uniref:Glucans biosynthesis protein D n=1 Tax=Halomonas halmophila TaxID=252 RepID=A0A4Y4EVX6_9GAMM|nr:glucan biosynthesis protein D [Halomonas halmophila]GED22072.1 glucans biosynthesis protein D [Halomonas halmophila]